MPQKKRYKSDSTNKEKHVKHSGREIKSSVWRMASSIALLHGGRVYTGNRKNGVEIDLLCVNHDLQ